ncbi:uncharacterized protein V6R79_017074 [Siganus canaliculatus]
MFSSSSQSSGNNYNYPVPSAPTLPRCVKTPDSKHDAEWIRSVKRCEDVTRRPEQVKVDGLSLGICRLQRLQQKASAESFRSVPQKSETQAASEHCRLHVCFHFKARLMLEIPARPECV